VGHNQLLVSFDGASFGFPHEITGRGNYKGNDWYHFDQAMCDSEFKSVQSWVTANDVGVGDSTLTVLEGSHKLKEYFAYEHNLLDRKDNWYKMDNKSKESREVDWFLERGCVKRDILCSAGSMVFWDSRTCHAGKEPLSDRENMNFRNVVYLSYAPKAMASKTVISKRIDYYMKQRTTGHWIHKPKLFTKSPRTYGKEMPIVVRPLPPKMTKLGYSLVGFENQL